MAAKFPLIMSDGASVRTIEELREHFELKAVLDYYSNGRLIKWLEDRYYDEEAERVKALESDSADFKQSLCNILGVAYEEQLDAKLDLRDIKEKNERREHLKKYTTDDKILAAIDSVVFTQEELDDLKFKGLRNIYLCGKYFIIPWDIENVTYIGVNNPMITFERDREIATGIDIQGVEFDIEDYVIDGNYNVFLDYFSSNIILGIKLLHMAAEEGNAAAQFNLGMCYFNGNGVEQDYSESIKWFQKATEQDNANVLYAFVLGMCYNKFFVGGEYPEKAAKLFQRAATGGLADGQVQLGICYVEGNGIEQNFSEAVKLFLQVAELNELVDARAQYYLGECYYCGEGIEQNFLEAVKWYQKAAEQGDIDAQRRLGICYEMGEGVEADIEEAVKWYQKAAEQGDTEAQIFLGRCYFNGEGIEEDKEKAVKWYQKAARQGNVIAQFALGICYCYGEGIEQNFLETVKWYQKAAEQGDIDAQNSLNECISYFERIGEDEETVELYQRAVNQQDAVAQRRLGIYYEMGEGVEADIEEAVKWYQKAAEQGDTEAVRRLKNCNLISLRQTIQGFADSLHALVEGRET